MKLNKTEDYMRQKYRIEITELEDDLGGGYLASIPQLGSEAFRGYGETADEALKALETVKRHLFTKYLTKGIHIPLPQGEEFKKYSGKVLLRMPKELHWSLANLAKANESSLNSYINYLLTRRSVLESMAEEIKALQGSVWDLSSKFKKTPTEKSEFWQKTSEWSQAS